MTIEYIHLYAQLGTHSDWCRELLEIYELPETYAHPFYEELCLEDIYKYDH